MWKRLRRESLVTSNHVLDETLTLLARRAGGHFAADRADNIYASDVLEILHCTREDELAAVRLLRKYSDQQVSFTDCTSFVLMKSRQISSVFTYDLHFQRAGFHVVGDVDS